MSVVKIIENLVLVAAIITTLILGFSIVKAFCIKQVKERAFKISVNVLDVVIFWALYYLITLI